MSDFLGNIRDELDAMSSEYVMIMLLREGVEKLVQPYERKSEL